MVVHCCYYCWKPISLAGTYQGPEYILISFVIWCISNFWKISVGKLMSLSRKKRSSETRWVKEWAQFWIILSKWPHFETVQWVTTCTSRCLSNQVRKNYWSWAIFSEWRKSKVLTRARHFLQYILRGLLSTELRAALESFDLIQHGRQGRDAVGWSGCPGGNGRDLFGEKGDKLFFQKTKNWFRSE